MVFRAVILIGVLAHAAVAAAQTSSPAFEVGATFATTGSGQFHTRDIGAGGWLGWRLNPVVGIEGELTYHGDPVGEAQTFYKGRVEGLFGVTIGPRLGVVRPFASVRPGFVTFRQRGEPIACILIFPPPLSCQLAADGTVFAFDLGGGLEVSPTPRSVIRGTISDRMLRYPSAAFDTSGVLHDDSFIGHDLRFAAGVGWRF